ncbi:hypothetical protein NG895_17600 [Aeoliella sp. ICT_H6.2]|uniref:DUF6933 domain-containing protein n=1 Tax=Aeoliella straminimaris TaxID=2954799 RepID=A0A9X2JHE3_9BACT|nr:hypothetical protein [Aeoliella straminimaris]MCO6045716.1 hypothetical protein [Aeoliella straminimaris]
MIVRLSAKLATKIKASKLAESPLDENLYADWSASLFTAARTQYILLTNTPSLYSCVLYGRGITDDNRLIGRALDAIREFMEDDGQQFVYQRFIAPSAATVKFAKALNRSVTGSMTDQVKFAKILLEEDEQPPSEIGHVLNETPMSALIGGDGKKYGYPKEVFKRLLDGVGQ